MPQPKTNAMRLLEQAHVPYEVLSYAYDEEDLSGVTAARHLGVDPEIVFKTLVLRGARHPILLALLPVERTLDMKKLAVLCGEKRVEPVHVKELLPLTGYMRGGCSPIGMKKSFPVYADSCLTRHPQVLVNAGKRGLQLKINPQDLIAFCQITVGDISTK
ncbi:MAG: Cys-tRNA(Pro) deacylase [Christensenellales bacterium]|jgi:Cys-tRNA(Pro)/Cys-tRNA(Cys) deacylase